MQALFMYFIFFNFWTKFFLILSNCFPKKTEGHTLFFPIVEQNSFSFFLIVFQKKTEGCTLFFLIVGHNSFPFFLISFQCKPQKNVKLSFISFVFALLFCCLSEIIVNFAHSTTITRECMLPLYQLTVALLLRQQRRSPQQKNTTNITNYNEQMKKHSTRSTAQMTALDSSCIYGGNSSRQAVPSTMSGRHTSGMLALHAIAPVASRPDATAPQGQLAHSPGHRPGNTAIMPSTPCKGKSALHPAAMLRRAVMLLMLFVVGVGSVRGAEVTLSEGNCNIDGTTFSNSVGDAEIIVLRVVLISAVA